MKNSTLVNAEMLADIEEFRTTLNRLKSDWDKWQQKHGDGRTHLVKIAQQYRAEHGETGVVFSNNQPVSWVGELRNPEQWKPGVIAVDVNDQLWLTTGNNLDAADRWEPVFTEA